MSIVQAYTAELSGTNYEIGYQLGKLAAGIPPLAAVHTGRMEGFGAVEQQEAIRLFERWCPGLVEELAGFGDGLGISPEQVLFYAMTYLVPRCSHMALLPGMTEGAKPLLARNYEFSHKAEDFALVRTSVSGRYTHMGTSVMQFGRDDGFNEHGLAVTMSSCGFPVGAMPGMRSPGLKGLQFWAVIRSLLENCRDVDEALAYLEGMPIAYNLNLILLDKGGHAALVETMNGQYAAKRLGPDSPEQLLWATNHPVMPELIPLEPQGMSNSIHRYEWIRAQLEGASGVTVEQLKKMLLACYPNGLCCHYYEDFFGTTKSMVISPADGTIELCWGGLAENGWQTYDIRQPLPQSSYPVKLHMARAGQEVFGYVPLA